MRKCNLESVQEMRKYNLESVKFYCLKPETKNPDMLLSGTEKV